MFTHDVVIVTEDRFEAPPAPDDYIRRLLHEEALLQDALERQGLRVERVSWSRPGFAWNKVRAALFRSTWDYFHRFAEFSPWLDRVARETHLINSESLLRWNVDKHYLQDLERAGAAIVPTRFVESDDTITLAELLDETAWNEAVIKPAISGAARHTYRFGHSTATALESKLRPLRDRESFLVQEFQAVIVDTGELSLVYAGNELTHAVRKNAKPGDFRVQDDHGGVVSLYVPDDDDKRFADQVLAACPEPPSYARVDFVTSPRRGRLLMELELIEPELFFRFHEPATDRLAAEVVEILARRRL